MYSLFLRHSLQIRASPSGTFMDSIITCVKGECVVASNFNLFWSRVSQRMQLCVLIMVDWFVMKSSLVGGCNSHLCVLPCKQIHAHVVHYQRRLSTRRILVSSSPSISFSLYYLFCKRTNICGLERCKMIEL